jgi:hypothetical protein
MKYFKPKGIVMQKKNKAFLLLLLTGSLACHDIIAEESKSFFWEGVGIAAAVVVAGVGACKLVQWCFSETNEQLVERAEREYNDALQFVDDILLFEQGYSITYITPEDRQYVFHHIYEPVLYSLARIYFDRGLESYTYINMVANAKNELDSLSKTLHHRIKKQKGKYVDHHIAQTIRAMHMLISKIDDYLPHLTLFCDYIKHNRSYFELFDIEARLYKQYDTQIRIINSNAMSHIMAHDVRQSVAWEYSDRKYPFIVFVSGIESDIATLKSYIHSLSSYYTERINYARQVLNSLKWIKNVVATDERYTYEKYQAEQERLERLKIEALQEQNRLLVQNNMLQAQKFAQQKYQDNNCQVTVILQ